jgi:ATP-dependent DNA ligase
MVRVKPTGAIELWTRRASVINDLLPNLREQLARFKVKPDSILDGELMEHRGQVKEQLVLWGCIKFGSRWLSSLSYREANDVLKGIVGPTANVSLAIQTQVDKVKFYHRVMAGEFGPGNEGIVLKNLEAPVPFGWKGEAINRQWYKVKPHELADGTML